MADPVEDAIARYGALFERDGDRFVPTPLARGPWDPHALHGGAPSALFAWACETHDPGDATFIARLTVELLRPVPLAPLHLRVRTFRPGKKVQWLEAALFDGDDREVTRATALRIRTEEVDTRGVVAPNEPVPPPHHDAVAQFPFADRVADTEAAIGYWTANETVLVAGTWLEPGPGTAWLRLRSPVIAGEPVSPFMRVAAVADFGSGVGNPVRMTESTAINAEVTIHVHRHPASEWVCLESGGWAQPHGVGLAASRLFDEQGPIGRAMQALLVEPITRRPPPGPRR